MKNSAKKKKELAVLALVLFLLGVMNARTASRASTQAWAGNYYTDHWVEFTDIQAKAAYGPVIANMLYGTLNYIYAETWGCNSSNTYDGANCTLSNYQLMYKNAGTYFISNSIAGSYPYCYIRFISVLEEGSAMGYWAPDMP